MGRWRTFVAIGAMVALSAVVGTPGATGSAAASGPRADDLPRVAAAPAGQVVQLRVGYLTITGNIDLPIARDAGYFAEEGLAVDLTAMAGGAEILPALIGGSLDLGTLNIVTHILAQDQGFRAKGVAGGNVQRRGEPIHGILVRADSPIQGARDLEGRTLATNTLHNIDHIMQQVWLQRNGADPRRVNFVEIPFPQHPAALAQGRVDAIGPAEPFMTIALSQGARLIAHHYTDVNEETLLAYYGATDDWLARNADLAHRFHRAVRRTNDYLASNRQEIRNAAVRYLNMDPELAQRVGLGEPRSRVDPALIQWWIDAVRSFGLINSQINPLDLLYETLR